VYDACIGGATPARVDQDLARLRTVSRDRSDYFSVHVQGGRWTPTRVLPASTVSARTG